VYIEDIPVDGLGEDRTHAVRATVFEFGNRIGGFVEYFAIDGEVNTRTEPWFRPTRCAWFGDGPIRTGDFVIEADGIGGTDRLLIRASWTGRRRPSFTADWVSAGGVTGDPSEFEAPSLFVRDEEVLASRECEVPLIDANP
jgi:hypothetical protein